MEQVKVKELFTETKKVLAEYKAKVEELDKQEQELKGELEGLQLEMTANILDQENAPVSERVYLKIRNKEIVSKSEIIVTLLEELAEERTALKLEFAPIFKEAIRKDRTNSPKYSANEIVNKHRYQMLKEVAEIGKQMQQQYNAIAPDIYEVFEDETVKENVQGLRYVFYREQYTPFYSEPNDTVVSRQDVFSATTGFITDKYPKPKDV